MLINNGFNKMNTLPTNNNRLDYLDAVRAFALILGVFFHACLSFMPVFIGWAVMDISTSEWIKPFVLISHSFRMELFFLIAGFFSHMTFHKQGGRAFWQSRLVRIVIPLIIGWFLLRPLIVATWDIGGQSMRGDADILAGLIQGFRHLINSPNELFTGTHLWFLYYLCLTSLSVLGIRYLVNRHKSSFEKLARLTDKVIAWLCHSSFSVVILAIPTAVILASMSSWSVDTPDKSLIPHLPALLLFSGFFLFGWILNRQSTLLERLLKLNALKLGLAGLAIAVSVALSSYEMQYTHPQYSLIKSAFLTSYAVMMWSMVFLIMAVCKRLFSKPNKIVRYVAESSYWIYLVHLPIVIALQIAFAEQPIHWLIKFIGISVLTILTSLVLYELFVRTTFLGGMLNGKKHLRALFMLNNKARLSKIFIKK